MLGFLGLAALVPLTRAAIPPLPAGLVTLDAILSPLTGFAAWLVWRRIDVGLDRKRAALRLWGWLMLVSGLWPDFLPLAPSPTYPAACLLLCLGLGSWTALAFRRLQPKAAVLMLPSLAWSIASVAIVTTRF